MDLDLLEVCKISPQSRLKIICDFFPNHQENFSIDKSLNSNLNAHAAALCLYSAALITKAYETSFEELELVSNDRELAYQEIIRNSPKFTNLTENQIKDKAHELIIKDIRNSFAHGNFDIGYDVKTNELYFILKPKHGKLSVDTPIVISSKSLKKAIMAPTMALTFKLLFGDDKLSEEEKNNINNLLKNLLLPTQLLKISDHYLENKELTIDSKRYFFIQYMLLVSQITYELDDYYLIFDKNSTIFERISFMRNAMAHNNILFEQLGQNINYTDRDKSLNQSIQESVATLITANDIKQTIMRLLNKGKSQNSINELKERLKECFDIICINQNKNINTESSFEV